MVDKLRTDRQVSAAHLRLERKFGRRGHWKIDRRHERLGWHSTSVKKNIFVVGVQCDRKGCGEPVVKRIGINVWGTLIEHDVCQQHVNRDGVACDGL